MFNFWKKDETLKPDRKVIEIYEYTDNNECTKRQVYPEIEPPPDVPKHAYIPISKHRDTIIPGDKCEYAHVIFDGVGVPDIRYKMVIKNNDTVAVIKKFADVCGANHQLFLVTCVGNRRQCEKDDIKDEVDALASVCMQGLPTDDAKAKYKKDIENVYNDYQKIILDKINGDAWKERWRAKNKDTIG